MSWGLMGMGIIALARRDWFSRSFFSETDAWRQEDGLVMQIITKLHFTSTASFSRCKP